MTVGRVAVSRLTQDLQQAGAQYVRPQTTESGAGGVEENQRPDWSPS